MESYLGITRPLHLSPRNLFCLQYNFHMGGLDRAQFVIVPKFGQLVVHLLKASPEAANLYHNVPFDHSNSVSHEAIYARFAWALIKIWTLTQSGSTSRNQKRMTKGETVVEVDETRVGRVNANVSTEMEAETQTKKTMGPIIQANQPSDPKDLHYCDTTTPAFQTCFLKSPQVIASP